MSRPGGIPMSQRVLLGNAGGRAVGEEPPARHCWVAGGVDDAGVKRPGLLVEWRRSSTGWEGRVVYVAGLRSQGWVLVEEWLPATLLSPE